MGRPTRCGSRSSTRRIRDDRRRDPLPQHLRAPLLVCGVPGERHGRSRHRQCRPHAHRPLHGGLRRRCAPRSSAPSRSARRSRARGSPADVVDEVIMGNVLQAGCGQNPARQARAARGHPRLGRRVHGQQGVRLGAEGGDARRAGDPRRRRRDHRGGRHGDHDRARRTCCPKRAKGSAPRPRQADRRDDQRRPVGRLQRLPHGRRRRSSSPTSTRSRARRRTSSRSRSTRRRAAAQAAGKFKDEIVAGQDPAAEGRADRRRHRRGAARRQRRREARQAASPRSRRRAAR